MEPVDFRALFRCSPNAYLLLDRHLQVVDASAAYLALTSRTREELIGHPVCEAFPPDPQNAYPVEMERVLASQRQALATGEVQRLAEVEYALRGADGRFHARCWSVTHTPLPGPDGSPQHLLQHVMDITELRTPAVADVARRRDPNELLSDARGLLAERLRLRRLFESAPGFFAIVEGPEHRFELVNEAYQQLVGERPLIGLSVAEALPELTGQGLLERLDEVHARRQPFIARQQRVLLQREPGVPLEEMFLDFVYQPICEDDGTVSGILVQGHEVTQQKRVEDRLLEYRMRLEREVEERTLALARSEAERRQAEEALLQARKLEAVGQLTGGIAHDLNNVLQIIGGNLQLLRRALREDALSLRRLESAVGGVERGGRLASQLLSFARRQPLSPQTLQLEELFARMQPLLQRSLGEAVRLEWQLEDGVWPVYADPHNLENVLLNLALNAGEAMEGQGGFRLEARNAHLDEAYSTRQADVQAGDYVELRILDEGSGMSREVRERAFEPFFSTRRSGRGTGLGLSMVYGFAKQSGGHVTLESEEGVGTCVTLYLPRGIGEQQSLLPEPEVPEVATVPGGEECILVVEDEPGVRATVVGQLSELGYRVLQAADADAALKLLHAGERIDLLFSDVVMPGSVSCIELARQARQLMPEVAVLYTSGYPENVVVHGGRLDPGVDLLNKPYSPEALAERVRRALAAAPRRETMQQQAQGLATAGEQGVSVLFVEDDDTLRLLTCEVIEEFGHRVQACVSAEEALAQLVERSFDVLLTDVGLEGMSGIELARQVLAREDAPRVVIASGYPVDVRQEGIPDARLLLKPYDVGQVRELLEQLCGECRAQRTG